MSNTIKQIEALAKQIDEAVTKICFNAAADSPPRVGLIAAIAALSRVSALSRAELEHGRSNERDTLRNIADEVTKHNAEVGGFWYHGPDTRTYIPADGVTAGAAVVWERHKEIQRLMDEIADTYPRSFSALCGQGGFYVFSPDPEVIHTALCERGRDASLRTGVDDFGEERPAVFVPYNMGGGGDVL